MKTILLTLCKWLGLFYLAKQITARRPRILCYHGISVDDEHLFSPGVFMQANTFAGRMAILERWGYKPVSLDELYRQHTSGRYNKDTLVITIDDGWAAIEHGMLPVLKKYNFNATLYLSSYYVIKQRPVFKLSCYYLFWKYNAPFVLAADSCLKPFTSLQQLDIDNLLSIWAKLDSSYEQVILQELADYFGEDLTKWQQNGKLMFLSAGKVTAMAEQGLAIELHTHRHKFSELNLADAAKELADNQHHITQLTGKTAQHFCFPRGEYQPQQLNLLAAQQVKTATTTENELVSKNDSLLMLPRLVDNDKVSELEFEAELTGLMTLLRLAASLVKRGK
ncbi:polysaccharide deacetylase family protein [Arsukibacterium indicum]|uniref:Polysaccharide deacetylase family protein n=1 Tax=Arsukibacterium indicum TaxID=2848612 RepID=A0ABS6MFW5_9GAMM|nr:polysaccharide deacetylase family protein [Arsukibacterium indicum]MBV2127707.1 polysaccharide deacetylase family protein [Arsukibacterium indicum]